MDYLDLRQQGDGSYVEAIKDGEIVKVPEKVAIMEDLFVLRKIVSPTQAQQAPGFSGSPSHAVQNSLPAALRAKDSSRNSSIMYDWKHGKFGVKKNNVVNDLVPNFNWEISRYRKMHNMSRVKLAQMINAAEDDVKMIELAQLPADDFVLISRIEQVFGINLRKNPASIAQVNVTDLQKANEQKKKAEIANIGKEVFKDSAMMQGGDIEIIE